MLLNCGVGEDSWESLGLQGAPTSHPKGNQSWIFNGRIWCWSWNSNTLATWCEELTNWKRSWCWERLKAGGEGSVRVQDGWMVLQTQCTWVWASAGSWWRTGKPYVLQSIRLQSQTLLNNNIKKKLCFFFYLAALGLPCYTQAFSTSDSWASPCSSLSCYVAQALETQSLVVVTDELSSLKTCGIFPEYGLNPCPLHWLADSSKEVPSFLYFISFPH